MRKKLSVREFTWVKKPSIYTEEAIKMYDESNDYDAILEVDIEYSTMARIKHKDLPLLPQRKEINNNLPFKPQQKGINEDLPQRKEINKDLPQPKEINKHLPQGKKINEVHKLVTTLDDKEKYVIHITALKQALHHGLKLKKVQRVIEFK